ncbi:outer-membrane lipoprotein carrier protein [Candidatus Photodesmus katoptron]|uniref:Outer-membrane lipoprotein carrier protein n=1 Tax=Candidatus Photodesmus katoptron Akat1 TaxID=1236703 RepID=S3DIT0_9GAMM|nr:outer membrane lipoprotein chaperone LolA [Candidatus Photodesmus katoptron]EPE37625.1 outer membrane lipocarrier protein LolA [Candidatus Photodesmus katoptron Akat1]KEY90656.1 outer-membrane lipoprotein carrier protein [Candidatus Photodesmus katoptron]
MKSIYILLLFINFPIFANSVNELNKRLAIIDGFSGDFFQKVISSDGDLIIEAEGSIEIARPNLFRWETKFPNENLLVSDGTIVWYYDPSITQITLLWQKQVIEQTPFLVLIDTQLVNWNNYNITQKGDCFTLTKISMNSSQEKFQIELNNKGILKTFSILEEDGQFSSFNFKNIIFKNPSIERFRFKIPKGVEVDDQRN